MALRACMCKCMKQFEYRLKWTFYFSLHHFFFSRSRFNKIQLKTEIKVIKHRRKNNSMHC